MFPSFEFRRRRRAAETLRFPLPIPARIAVVDAEFHLGANMKAFRSGDLDTLIDYAPDALVLPLDSALALSQSTARLPSLKFAIVALSSVDLSGTGPLKNHHRDLLWKSFGLPVFEQLRGWNGRVVARECEVHDGLHFDESATIEVPAGFSADIVRGHCDCGIETPRLRYRNTSKSRAVAA